MSRTALRVEEPGFLTTVQDLGRPGLGHAGVPPSGALDSDALRLANILLGNPENAAGLEMAFRGPVLAAERSLLFVVAGGRFGPDPGRVHALRTGERLDLRRASGDPRAVLAVAGGVDVPVVLGSRATCLPAGFGGLEGRALRRGDLLPLGAARETPNASPIPDDLLPAPADPLLLRVLLGPHAGLFSEESLESFFTARYELLSESNRIGFRLSGLPLGHPPENLPSEGALTGSIQVPPNGQPIVLMNDRPSSGGYPKIATVIEADRSLLARVRPGRRVGFVRVRLEEALALLQRKEERIREWARST